MNNKEIALSVANAFNNSDVDTIVSHFHEDGQWNMLGDKIYAGRETIKEMFLAHAETKVLTCTMDHVIADGDTVAIDGYVECQGKDEQQMNMYYCDIYELRDGKVKNMISYTVDKKKEA